MRLAEPTTVGAVATICSTWLGACIEIENPPGCDNSQPSCARCRFAPHLYVADRWYGTCLTTKCGEETIDLDCRRDCRGRDWGLDLLREQPLAGGAQAMFLLAPSRKSACSGQAKRRERCDGHRCNQLRLAPQAGHDVERHGRNRSCLGRPSRTECRVAPSAITGSAGGDWRASCGGGGGNRRRWRTRSARRDRRDCGGVTPRGVGPRRWSPHACGGPRRGTDGTPIDALRYE